MFNSTSTPDILKNNPMPTNTKEFHCDGWRPEWKSYAQYLAFMKACREWKKVLIVFPFWKMYSPEMMKDEIAKARAEMKAQCLAVCTETIEWKKEVLKGNTIKTKDDVLFWYELWIWDVSNSISSL